MRGRRRHGGAVATAMVGVVCALAWCAGAHAQVAGSPEAPSPPVPPAAKPASDAATPRRETTALFVVHFTTGPAWVAEKPAPEQAHFAAHSANLRRLREAGILLVGGHYSDKGVVILRADDEAAARRELDADPSLTAGVFVAEVFAFSPFYDGCIPKPAAKKRD